MKKINVFFLLLLQTVILPQNNFIRQITHGDFDARNVSQPRIPFQTYFYYEIHSGDSSNIVLVNYNSFADDFSDTTMITSDNFQNINPVGGDGIVAFQTNKNGNWDIAFCRNINGIWGDIEYATNSPDDEENLKRVYTNEYGFGSAFFILYQKTDTIFLARFEQNSVEIEPVLYNSPLYTYSDYTGVYYYNWGGGFPRSGYHVIAVQTDGLGIKRLISRYRPVNGDWGNINFIIDNCDCANPSVQYIDWETNLIYEDTLHSNRRLFKIFDWDAQKTIDSLPIPFTGNLSNFSSDIPNIITKREFRKSLLEEIYCPHSYFIRNNNTLQIRVNLLENAWLVNDTLINITYPESKLSVGNLGFTFGGEVFYTIWEDSSNGRIHLFGRRQIVPIGAVEDESYANDFVLYQNYPNPFNPSTKIEYKLLQASDVKFNIFNLLGEKVFEQNFGYQTAGSYKVNFDGKNLSSGVYIYSIYTNENRLSRKMMLMK